MDHMACSENKITVLKPARKYQIIRYVTILKMFYRQFPASSVSDEMIGRVRYEYPKKSIGLVKKNLPSMFFVI